MTLKGNVSISRVSGAANYISIIVVDDASSNEIIDIQIPLETFGAILTGLSRQDCTFDIKNLEKLGKTREIKCELVDCPKLYKDDKETAKLLKPYEVDGWAARSEDLFNRHNYRGKNKVEVTFIRYV